MSKQSGRGGMGSHKHGVSGRTHKPARLKQELGRLANRDGERQRKLREARRASQRWTDSVRDLFD